MIYPQRRLDVDPVIVHAKAVRRPPAGRPYVLMNMVSSVDGAAAVDGVSGPLDAPGDKDVFLAIRAVADVIVVGAGTARAERYGKAKLTPPLRKMRVGRGQAELPTIAVVSRSLDLDFDSSLFVGDGPRTIVVTCASADGPSVERLRGVADIVVAGDDDVDLSAAIARLNARVCVLEGGPSLNGAMLEAGLVDEINLTIAPMTVGASDSERIIAGGAATAWTPAHIVVQDGAIFVRYLPDL